jgi:nicotinate phosphoribosyltransferase
MEQQKSTKGITAILGSQAALYTDLYQLTMAQGFFLSGKTATPAVYDYTFRENPFQGGYVVFAGIGDVLELLAQLRFDEEAIHYLRKLKFREEFLHYLQQFRFSGTVHAMREGEIVFPSEPLVRVEGNLVEVQLIETLLLNILNFESLIATKASRIRFAAGNRKIKDFGLRRAQGLGGILASRAAIIGGVDTTTNLFAAYHFGLDVSGTQAHSWIQSFSDELTAFRRYAELYPDDCVLLVDTYGTVKSGIPHAITVAKELEAKGKRLAGVRLDSGDLASLSKKVRVMLDAAGLRYVQIIASNQLDEYLIYNLTQQNAPIDSYGVGTKLISANGSSALEGVYKLSEINGQPSLKVTDNFLKTTMPGKKNVFRFFDDKGMFDCDGVSLAKEAKIDSLYHPSFMGHQRNVRASPVQPLMVKMMDNGKIILPIPSVQESEQYASNRFVLLPMDYKRFEKPVQYKVGFSTLLMNLRTELYKRLQQQPTAG